MSYAHVPGNEILPLPPIRSPDRGDGGRPWPSSAALQQSPQADGSSSRIYAPPVREPRLPPPDTRAERTRPVTTVAPAPLPQGRRWRDPRGRHPTAIRASGSDKAALRSLLWHGRFAELSRDIEELQARFEGDPLRESWPIDAAEAFASATRSSTPHWRPG